MREKISVEVDYDGGSYEADVKFCYSLFPLLTIRLCISSFFATNVELQKHFAAG